MTAHLLRAAAIVIAIAAAIDPAITTPRPVRADIALVADTARDGALAERVARTLRGEFHVLRAPFAGAAATVVVGDPPADAHLAAPVFVIVPDRDEPHVAFESVHAPTRTPLEAAAGIEATVRVSGANGAVEVLLSADGVAVDRAVVDPDGLVRLTWVPARTGAVPIRLTATVGGEERAAVDAVIDVHARRWAVLFHDTRPSWQSTFVRRALERDPRFDIAMRVVTSRAASVGAGASPVSLADPESLNRFDAIVVGAPEDLGTAAVAALEHYLRRRGGSVILLFDRIAAGPFDRLTGVSTWGSSRAAEAVPITGAGTDTVRASELRWPRALPAGASPVGVDPAGRAILWTTPAGAGRILVSGALDAWRLRDPAQSGFAAFWRARIADAAAASPPMLEARLERAVVPPGGATTLVVTVREPALADVLPGEELRASISARLESPNATAPLRVFPRGGPGRFEAPVRAPEASGLYHIRVTSGDAQASAAIRVADGPAFAEPDRGAFLEDWAASRGGSVLAAADAGRLPELLARSLSPVRRPETWHPMRSPWWIVPFALALGAEWWWRRRRGLA